MTTSKRTSGVTLLELMIVLAIVSILATLAIPGYRQYTMRGHRAEGAMALMQMAANQEKFYLQNNTYANNAADLGFPTGESEHGRYALAVNTGTAVAFQVQATAQNEQADDTDCAILAIDQTGFRYGGPGPIGAGSNDPDCWRGR
jgi:type IV pilus assembly protein PilE